MAEPGVVLFDANAIIEAVRTGCWPAITGQLTVETVETCRDETLAGSPTSQPGYATVTRDDLGRLHDVYVVDDVMRASFKLAYGAADGMDAGEHDLFAFAFAHGTGTWTLCSPDKASVRAAVALEWGDRLCSLEELARTVGVRPNPPLRRQFTSEWLRSFRTKVRLEGL